MSELYGSYTAEVVGDGDVTQHIDVRPPFVPSQEFLTFCGEVCHVTLDHFISTPRVTRLGVTNPDEEISAAAQAARFRNAAAFLVKALQFVDEGSEIVDLDLDVWHEENSGSL